MNQQFPLSAEALHKFDNWVNLLAACLPKPKLVTDSGKQTWRYADSSPQVFLVAKSVRMSTALMAAAHLTDVGLVTEAASLLRIAADFSHEIKFIYEGVRSGTMTSEQKQHLDDFFAQLRGTPEELGTEGRRRFVNREALFKAQVRLMNEKQLDGENVRRLARTISGGLDGYVHGYYATAMELYDGERFHVDCLNYAPSICVMRCALASTVVAALHSLTFVATAFDRRDLAGAILAHAQRISDSDEDDMERCNPAAARDAE
jgi:hypothetical protein